MAKLKYIIALILVAVTVFALSAFITISDTKKIKLSDKEIIVSAEKPEDKIFLSTDKAQNLKKISSFGMLEMYLDEKTLAVCILDTISGKMWRSLPENSAGEKAANLVTKVITNGNEYTLNSQSDSLALDCSRYETKDNGLILYYTFRRSLEKDKKIDLTIPLKLTLSEGSLSVKVNCNEIVDNSTTKIYLHSLSLLPYFGADSKGQKNDFILLPSASGILLDTYKPAESFNEISLSVYGEDLSDSHMETDYVPIGAYGMKVGNNAFVSIIDKGDTIATINANKAVKDLSYNRVGAEFEITAATTDENAIYLSQKPYEGELSISYRFLSGNNADYITMAGACRELLIRQGMLADGNIDSNAGYPFNVTIIANNEEIGISTSEDELTELLSSLNSKGIANVNAMLKDDGTLDIKDISDFAEKNTISLSVYKNLYSYSGTANLTIKGTKNILGINTSRLQKNADKIILAMRNNSVGVCLSDCGNILPTDYSKFNFKSRNDMLDTISTICTTLSSQGNLTVSKANIYTIKYADNIINIPLNSPLEDNPYCTAVPFLPAVLHGICDYSFTAINLSDDPTTATLKAIEYGAVPHYEWYFAQLEENDNMYYMNSLSQARLIYENMKNILGDLRDQRITSHEQVKKNVTCTIYSGGSEIYVNYNNQAITVGGINIDPMSFLRVN